MEEKSKYQYVFSMKLAGTLMANSFRLLRIDKHFKNNKYDVYVFEQSDKIQEFIDEYMKAKGK